jgi:hypothetical protein
MVLHQAQELLEPAVVTVAEMAVAQAEEKRVGLLAWLAQLEEQGERLAAAEEQVGQATMALAEQAEQERQEPSESLVGR